MRPSHNIKTSHTNLPVTQRHIPEEMRPPSQTNHTFIYTVTAWPFPVSSLSITITDVSKTSPSTGLQVFPIAFWILLKVSTAHPVNIPRQFIFYCIFPLYMHYIKLMVATLTLDSIPLYYQIMNASHNPKVQGFHKRMVGFKVSIEENLVRRKKQNMFYFTRKTSEFHMSYMM